MGAAVLAAHLVLGWLLLRAVPLPAIAAAVQPLTVQLVAAPQAPPLPEPPPLRPRTAPRPDVPFVPAPAIDLPPPPAPTLRAVTVPPPRELPAPAAVVIAPVAPASAATVAAAPKTIPPSAVQYLVPPAPVYPLASRRLRETGTVLLRVLVDDAGRPQQVQVEQSSGHERLDDAAVQAMRGARFRPYTEGGQAFAVWAPAPIAFEL
jgi:protein TonB